MSEKYKKLVDYLTKACASLRWEFTTNVDVVDRAGLDDAMGFSIDKIDYFVAPRDKKHPVSDCEMFYASVMVQHHGSRHEPPSEDDQPLPGVDVSLPQNLVSTIISAHWTVRYQWAMEATFPEQDPMETD